MNKIKNLNKTISQRVDKTDEELLVFRENITTQVSNMENNNRIKMDEVQKENKKEIDKINETVSNKVEGIKGELGQVKGQVGNIQEELGILQSRPVHCHQNLISDHRETIYFKDYRRNPIDFLERVTEWLNRTRENRWSNIKNFLDEGFKGTNDNWWSAIRNEVNDYNSFKQIFREKYWSESVQNIVRDNLCNGKYEANWGQPPTAYFLGKVCVAWNLEPRIPEECLITKLAYHFEDGISQARLNGQIKTIGAMEALLGNYEQEGYYRRSRRQYERPNADRGDQNRDQRQRVNYVRSGDNNNGNYNNNNNYHNNNNNRGQNRNNNNNYQNNNNHNQNRTRRRSFDNGRNSRYYNNRNNEERRYPHRSRSSEDHARNQEVGREFRTHNRSNEETAASTQPQEMVRNLSLQ